MPLSSYLARRYAEYLARRPTEEWREAYADICDRTAKVGSHLNEHHTQPDEDPQNAVNASFNALGYGLDDYLEEVWYQRQNGIASIQQGGISQEAFEKVRRDEQFWPFFVQSLRLAGEMPNEELLTSAYASMIGWMDRFTREQGVSRRFPAFANRFFAACLPGRVTSIAAPGRLADLLSALGAWEKYQEFRGDVSDSWLRQNRFLLEPLRRG